MQTVGIIGGTGSAKTTLVQLIPRLYDATRGHCAGSAGRDVRDYDLAALRDAVGIVLQKNVLFSGIDPGQPANGAARMRTDDDAVGGLPRRPRR